MARNVQKQIKVVQILARYAYKSNGVFTGLVSYKVRSSDGKNCYCTTLLNGKAVGCSCPARKPCYHMTQLEVIEQARRAEDARKTFIAASQIVATPVISLPVLTPEADVIDRELEELLVVVEAQHAAHGLKKLPGAFQTVTKNLTTGRPTDISTMGTLNGNRAFSLLR